MSSCHILKAPVTSINYQIKTREELSTISKNCTDTSIHIQVNVFSWADRMISYNKNLQTSGMEISYCRATAAINTVQSVQSFLQYRVLKQSGAPKMK